MLDSIPWHLVFAAALAVSCTTMLVQRLLFPEQEARNAAEYLNKPLGWEVRKSDLAFTRHYLRQTMPWLALGAATGWVWLVVGLLNR